MSDIAYLFKQALEPYEVQADTPYIGLEHIPRRSITLSEWGTANDVSSSKIAFEQFDVLFGKIRPYFHKVGFTITAGITSTDSFVIRSYEKKHWCLLLMLVSSASFVATASKTVKEGSKMPRADWAVLQQFNLLMPDNKTLNHFSGIIENITQQCMLLVYQNKKLATARDLLLPRLMNGEIIV